MDEWTIPGRFGVAQMVARLQSLQLLQMFREPLNRSLATGIAGRDQIATRHTFKESGALHSAAGFADPETSLWKGG